jgi:hypothetical protein
MRRSRANGNRAGLRTKGALADPFFNMWEIVGWMDDNPTKGMRRDM